MAKLVRKGGKGSGNWGHAGRPGKVGGSAKNGSAAPSPQMVLPYVDDGNENNVESSSVHAANNGESISTEVAVALDEMKATHMGLLEEYDGDYEKRAVVSADLAERSGVDETTVDDVVEGWRQSSNGGLSSAFQQAVSDEFGDVIGTHLSDWQSKTYKKYDDPSSYYYRERTSVDPADMRKIAAAMYESTQDFLKEQGIDGLYLFRGQLSKHEDLGGEIPFGAPYKHENMNALESWSVNPQVAIGFAPRLTKENGEYSIKSRKAYGGRVGLIESTWVPRERIFSTPFTGIGMIGESEFIVMNSSNADTVDMMGVFDTRKENPSDGVRMTDYMASVYSDYIKGLNE